MCFRPTQTAHSEKLPPLLKKSVAQTKTHSINPNDVNPIIILANRKKTTNFFQILRKNQTFLILSPNFSWLKINIELLDSPAIRWDWIGTDLLPENWSGFRSAH